MAHRANCVSRGPQTTPGYWNDPSRTSERFEWLSVSPQEARRFYRTGDRVARLPGGEYIFIGRLDHQIKVFGHRVELGEIEAAFRTDPRISEAVAVGWPVEDGTARGIVVFACGHDLKDAELQQLARKSLPPWAVPHQIVVCDSLPLNANGKVDRKALWNTLCAAGDASGKSNQ